MPSEEENLKRELDTLRREKREADQKWREGVSKGLTDLNSTIGILSNKHDDNHAAMSSQIQTLSGKVSGLHEAINGKPDEPQSGMVVRLDRVEQRHATHSKAIWIAITAGIGSFVHAVWTMLTGGK